jgi:hypothetical protein
VRTLALMMGYVALAVLDAERHALEGLVVWYHNQSFDDFGADGDPPPSGS